MCQLVMVTAALTILVSMIVAAIAFLQVYLIVYQSLQPETLLLSYHEIPDYQNVIGTGIFVMYVALLSTLVVFTVYLTDLAHAYHLGRYLAKS